MKQPEGQFPWQTLAGGAQSPKTEAKPLEREASPLNLAVGEDGEDTARLGRVGGRRSLLCAHSSRQKGTPGFLEILQSRSPIKTVYFYCTNQPDDSLFFCLRRDLRRAPSLLPPPPAERCRDGSGGWVRILQRAASQGAPKLDPAPAGERQGPGPGRAPGWAQSQRPSDGCKRLPLPRGASTRPRRAPLPVACHRPAGHTPGAGWRLRQGSRGNCGGAQRPEKLLWPLNLHPQLFSQTHFGKPQSAPLFMHSPAGPEIILWDKATEVILGGIAAKHLRIVLIPTNPQGDHLPSLSAPSTVQL
ncbi:achaete-scute homolog 1 isoform X2 [Panthera onca]|uniref:achaete-scute homolog 1 isoform X2 n=1 Tax=Panthera onca TaxID=9690 RepID=UPI002954EF7B|nr:achaete-scute homolog 1 isoform X2 [Panthera onca]